MEKDITSVPYPKGEEYLLVRKCSLPFRGGPGWGLLSVLMQSILDDAFIRRVVEEGKAMAGKYTPLEKYLRDLPADQKEVTLSFEEIEGIINSKLPSSAYGYRQWWENEKEGNHVNARAWANAGWRVESVDFNRKEARLVRT